MPNVMEPAIISNDAPDKLRVPHLLQTHVITAWAWASWMQALPWH